MKIANKTITRKQPEKGLTGKDFMHLVGISKSKEKNLSMQVDEILYGGKLH